ncbi:Ubiquitin-conjugating enzyme E2 J1 [Gracilariopsis chorda]|uniref:Ubiquitin-conjugating enzyme E2 J1 n=1 Tax=Gracilariopsis chorda TaxID=448386 RepID=A0A2V3INT9_9FLOR|nr:Ubiquitin-conjugating enzyme E2 J1 [Gracilariopsis chorda]|eukprot:PXF43723.1 Ubiquitin-conjugating enzyme E2 J1 [Gracilariopsis chorda]
MSNDAVRRIMAELKELSRLNTHPLRLFHASPLETDLFEWHFSVRGPPDTAFEGGIYHGRILLPPDYPLKPPEIILLTPNGRFEVGKRICLSVTAHHQETWQPSWGIRTILTALIGFMPSPAEGVGALDYPDDDRRRLARRSHLFHCGRCGSRPVDHLPPMTQTCSPANGKIQSKALRNSRNHSPSDSSTRPPAQPSQPSSSATHPSSASSSNPTAPSSLSDRPRHSPNPGGNSSVVPTVTRPDNANSQSESANANAHCSPAAQSATRQTHNDLRPTRPAAAQVVPNREERELLYVAYAIIAMMLAVVVRRVIKTMTES